MEIVWTGFFFSPLSYLISFSSSFQCRIVQLNWIKVRLGLVVGDGGNCLDGFFFSALSYLISFSSLQDGSVQIEILSQMDGRHAILRPLNNISVISGRWKVDNERLCAMDLRSRLRRFRLERGSHWVR